MKEVIADLQNFALYMYSITEEPLIFEQIDKK